MAQSRKPSQRLLRAVRPEPVSISPAPASTASAIELSAEDAQIARTQLLLIQHHQRLAQDLDAQLQAHIQSNYPGVDVAQGGGWRLNLAAGLLEPVKEPVKEPVREPEGDAS